MKQKAIGTLLTALLCAPACAMNAQDDHEPLGSTSQAIEHQTDVVVETTDGSLRCYQDTTTYDDYTRVCDWCERADGNINGQLLCFDRPKTQPPSDPGDDDCEYYDDCDDGGDYGDNPCAGIGDEYELAKCLGY